MDLVLVIKIKKPTGRKSRPCSSGLTAYMILSWYKSGDHLICPGFSGPSSWPVML
jgi:hypothetical protein